MLPAPPRPRWSRLAPSALALTCLAGAACRSPNVDPTVIVEDTRDSAATTVRGVVRHHESGAPVVARLTLHCECLGRPREATTDAAGSYAFAELPAGKYMIQVIHGDDLQRKRFDAREGRRVVIDFQVNPVRPPSRLG